MQRNTGIWARLLGFRNDAEPVPETGKGCTHVVLLDGTMSTLKRGAETNIGLTYRLLMELPDAAHVHVYYEPGIQWRGLRRSHEVMAGIGINRQIRRAYVWLATRYRPGDRVMLMGYSRGAYAVRSLGGLVDRLGLLRRDSLNQARVEQLYCLYREAPGSPEAADFKARHCLPQVPIAFLGAYDTVRALGIRYPMVWRMLPLPHPYHNHALGAQVKVARHALALDETRAAYEPILWDTTMAHPGQNVIQMWFKGSHGDIGGQLNGRLDVRPRSNISLTWLLEEAEAAGLTLPENWQERFEMDADAPSIGTFSGFGKLFWLRRRRVPGRDRSEALHPTAQPWAEARGIALSTGDAGSPVPG